MLSKRFVRTFFFLFLMKMFHKYRGTQSKLESTGAVPWNEKQSRNSNLIQEVLCLSDTERLVISRL